MSVGSLCLRRRGSRPMAGKNTEGLSLRPPRRTALCGRRWQPKALRQEARAGLHLKRASRAKNRRFDRAGQKSFWPAGGRA